ncbi:MAG: SLC13 family permease [Conexivisphaerales archaeon]
MALGNDARLLLAAVIFVAVYSMLWVRRKGKPLLPMWIIFLIGGILMLLTGIETVKQAASSIDIQVLVFLFGMFMISKGLELSGDLEKMSSWIVKHGVTPFRLMMLLSFGFGLTSAVLMNDSLAIIGTPILISYARKVRIDAKPLLYALAFAVTIGSAMTPMGNPQNMLIALQSGIKEPLVSFLFYIAPFSLIELFVTSVFLLYIYRPKLRLGKESIELTVLNDPELSRWSRTALAVSIIAIIYSNLAQLLGYSPLIDIAEASFIGSVFLLVASKRRIELLKRMDWSVLLMFVGLFVFTEGVYSGGIFNLISSYILHLSGDNLLYLIVSASILISQVISNVPLAILLMPLFKQLILPSQAGYWAAFAASSTLAGALTLLGAASNLIVAEQAQKYGESISFREFAKLGLVITTTGVVILLLTLKLYGL